MTTALKNHKSTTARYRNNTLFGGNRIKVLRRDKYKCVKCGMTNRTHRRRYGQSLAVDHIDNNGKRVGAKYKNNDLGNLQALCVRCHASKDISGENHGSAKLTWDKVRRIRKEIKNAVSEKKLAVKYGVNKSTIHDVVSGDNWRTDA